MSFFSPAQASSFGTEVDTSRPSPYNSPRAGTPQAVKLTRSARESSNSATSSHSPRGPLAPGSHNLSLGVGQIFLISNIADTSFENAIGTEVDYTYGVSDLFSFESNFGYSSHSSGTLSMTRLAAGVRTNLIYFDQLVPFASLGLGFYNPSATLASGATLSGLLFGLQLGGGVELLLSERFFFGSRLSIHNMFESNKRDSAGVNHGLGGSFISFLVHAGITF